MLKGRFIVAGLVMSSLVVAPSFAYELSAKQLGDICRATVATLMFEDVAIVEVSKVEEGTVYVQYRRPSDGTVWKNRCKIFGDRVVWGAVDVDGPGSGPGRWRDDPADGVVTFSLSPSAVVIAIKYFDGSSDSQMVDLS